MGWGIRLAKTLPALGLLMAPSLGLARESLGVFGSWGAFADDRPRRCFAIAEPETRRASSQWRPFVSVATWPERRVRAQIHVRLRKARAPGTPVILAIGPAQFRLVAGKVDAWAPDPRTDAAIVRAMRSGTWMRITARTETGLRFGDSYALRGAATAIDAAAIACVPQR